MQSAEKITNTTKRLEDVIFGEKERTRVNTYRAKKKENREKERPRKQKNRFEKL